MNELSELTTAVLTFLAIISLSLAATYLMLYCQTKLPRHLELLRIHSVRRAPCENPLADDTQEERYREKQCRNKGCITTGEYYVGLPQAVCRRCGKRTHYAAAHVPKWSKPSY